MRASICAVLLVVAACARGDRAAGDTGTAAATDTSAGATATAPSRAAAAPGARFAGRWMVTAYAGNDASPQTFTAIHDSSGNSLTVAGTDSLRYRSVSMSDTGFVLESEPFTDPDSKVQYVSRVEGRFVADSMVGTSESRPTKGGAPIKGRWSAHRMSP